LNDVPPSELGSALKDYFKREKKKAVRKERHREKGRRA